MIASADFSWLTLVLLISRARIRSTRNSKVLTEIYRSKSCILLHCTVRHSCDHLSVDRSKSRPHKRNSIHPHCFSTPTIAITRLTKTSTAAPTTSTATTTAAGVTKINGIIAPPHTYQRQLHHRTTGRVAPSNYSTSSTARGIGSAKAQPLVTGLGRGREGEGGGVGRFSSSTVSAARGRRDSDDVIRLCPIRHKVTEVCAACLAR